MNTPICDFIKKYAESENIRLHMPGHKGTAVLGIENLDITEIEGADVLYSAEGVIKESMQNASLLFNTAKTLYSTEGSSLCIRAMLYLTAMYAKAMGKSPLVLAGRNAHKAFISAAALVDFHVNWLYPEKHEGLLSCKITPESLHSYLEKTEEKPVALYITSPDYLGNITDIHEISKVCKKFGLLLLVDNAHGAYLNFLEKNQHPIALGADICCDSAHKTLPVLTGGAYLHISRFAPQLFVKTAENAMSLFASTSPSYLIMQSLDMANMYLADNYKEKLCTFTRKVEEIKTKLAQMGFALCGDEPLKITLSTKSYGYKGEELARILSDKGIVCEFADRDFLVLMLTPENSFSDLDLLWEALSDIKKRIPITEIPPATGKLRKSMEIREAVFSISEEISVKDAESRILANYTVSCPPAVPVAVCGEVIDKNTIKAFEYYGVKKIKVIKT